MGREDEHLFQQHRYKGRRFIVQKRGFFDYDKMLSLAQEQYQTSLQSGNQIGRLLSKMLPATMLLALPEILSKMSFVLGSNFASAVDNSSLLPPVFAAARLK